MKLLASVLLPSFTESILAHVNICESDSFEDHAVVKLLHYNFNSM